MTYAYHPMFCEENLYNKNFRYANSSVSSTCKKQQLEKAILFKNIDIRPTLLPDPLPLDRDQRELVLILLLLNRIRFFLNIK